MAKSLSVNSYPSLLTQIKNTIDSGRKEIEQVKALTCWHVGEHIAKHLLSHNGRAGYGDQLYQRLSKDLNINERTIQWSVRFFQDFPIPNARSELKWTHYRKLITVDDPLLRAKLLRKAERGNLTTRQLADAIKISTASGSRVQGLVPLIPIPSTLSKALKGLDYIIIRSSKSDKYDRYLADVFYGKDEKFLNQQLLDEGLAVGYQDYWPPTINWAT